MSLNNILMGGVYLLLGMFGGFYGFGLSLIIRMEWGLSGYVFVSGNVYNSSMSFHGLMMMFFMMMPMLMGGFGNMLVPIMLGNSDMMFESMNSLSLWMVVMSSGMMMMSSMMDGGVNCGWTFYVPLSS